MSKRKKPAEQAIAQAVIEEGPRLSYERARLADELTYEEEIRPGFTLLVKGGLGSMGVGTIAEIRRTGEKQAICDTLNVPSWVFIGKALAIWSAQIWARFVLDEPAGDIPLANPRTTP